MRTEKKDVKIVSLSVKGLNIRIRKFGKNTKKKFKGFINIRQNYNELKKKYNYLISSIKVLKTNTIPSDKPIKFVPSCIDFYQSEIGKILAVVE